MPYCCVPRCKSYSGNKIPGISFHEIPSDADLRQKWLKFISRDNWTPNFTSCYSTVCSRHFVVSDFKEGCKTRKLKKGVVPSVFNEKPSYSQPPTKARCNAAVKKREDNALDCGPARERRALEQVPADLCFNKMLPSDYEQQGARLGEEPSTSKGRSCETTTSYKIQVHRAVQVKMPYHSSVHQAVQVKMPCHSSVHRAVQVPYRTSVSVQTLQAQVET